MNKGFTLPEILIAIVFFVIGFFALSLLFDTSNKQVYTAQDDLFAYCIARERLSWMSETDFSQVGGMHDLLSQTALTNGYFYYDLNNNKKQAVYPALYAKFYIQPKIEDLGKFKRLLVKVEYKLKMDDPESREVVLERIVSNE
ncbi:MAG: prepilin-type N-terminal cleavage/methylation domain-containing protein [Candidatus Wallbacteria bacterium]|nr:prepilin-type N-terminal cleavage/methylation domain-containing protein [Candidatus Wallbacteria bacterium]